MVDLPTGFKPMLAATLKSADEASKLTFPCYISPKIDGIRCITDATGAPISRNGKPFANKHLVKAFEDAGIPYLDGELGFGTPTSPEFFNETSALVRTIERDFDSIDYYVFDRIKSGGYEERFIKNLPPSGQFGKINIIILEQRKVLDEESFQGWEEIWFKRGWEGIMGRPQFKKEYKYGRATIKSGELIKCKRFVTDEARIIGFVEMMQNNNEAEKDEWGHTTRSSHKENKTPMGMAGVILAKANNFDGIIRIGTGEGLTHELRRDMFENQAKYIDRIFTYQYQDGTDYEKTRFGSYKGFRDDGI